MYHGEVLHQIFLNIDQVVVCVYPPEAKLQNARVSKNISKEIPMYLLQKTTDHRMSIRRLYKIRVL